MEVLLAILAVILLLVTPLGRGIIYLMAYLLGVLAWTAVIGGVILLTIELVGG